MKTGELKQMYLDSLFKINFLSIFINPFFFIRKGLIRGIKKNAHFLSGRLLDFGCGRKPYTYLFAGVKEYIGLDIGGRGHSHEGEYVDVFYDGRKIPFADETFDSIFCSEVLEHVPNVHEIILEWYRVLRKGGKILVTIPFVWDEHELPYDFSRLTRIGIERYLSDGGFHVVHSETTTTYIETIGQMFISYVYGFFPKQPLVKLFLTLILVFPLNLMVWLLNLLLPRRAGFYHNTVIVAEKI